MSPETKNISQPMETLYTKIVVSQLFSPHHANGDEITL